MAAPISLLGQARAFARDFPRDQMPRDYLWDVTDFVPTIIDTSLTGRGAWKWGSAVSGFGDFEAGILAGFLTGDQLLAQTTGGRLLRVDQNPPYNITDLGAIVRAKQNPIQLYDTVIHFDRDGAVVPRLINSSGVVSGMDASAPKARVGSIWKDYVITDGGPGFEDSVRFSVPGQPTAAWDANAFQRTSLPITAIGVIRSVILVFHMGSTERIRGSSPPRTTAEGDLVLEPLFSRAGCSDPRSIAYWNENLIFADEHGVHITDGAVIRNLISQGGILYLWRTAYATQVSLTAQTFLDYYMITMRRSDAAPLTLICDLNRRQWFKFSNIDALSYVASGGSTGMERLWAGIAGTERLARLGPCFFPTLELDPIVDDNGVSVLPSFETPWYRFGAEGRKRVRFIYLSYDARSAPVVARDGRPAGWRDEYIEHEPPTVGAPLAVGDVIDIGYITTPQALTYESAGGLPATTRYKRFRLPVGKFPYGVAFRVRQTQATTALRVFDLAVESQAAERSRV